MWVYAYWLADEDGEAFVHCHGPQTTISLPLPDSCIDNGEVYDNPGLIPPRDVDLEEHLIMTLNAGREALAAVCLGTTSTCWTRVDNGDYWVCSDYDLTPVGLSTVNALSGLYGRRPKLVTYIDT